MNKFIIKVFLVASIITLILTTSINKAHSSCRPTRSYNKTQYPWNTHDAETKKYCKKRCPELDKEFPCLSRFIKFNKQDYHCICGQSNKPVVKEEEIGC